LPVRLDFLGMNTYGFVVNINEYWRNIEMRKKKTPLQQWAWNRYRLKGSVKSIMTLLKRLLEIKDISGFEESCLLDSLRELEELMGSWRDSHDLTRSWRSKK